ncbi:MAG: LUD domain-containing protein [Candidatus Helarchaeota archaeon]
MQKNPSSLQQRIEVALQKSKMNLSRQRALYHIRKKYLTLRQDIPFNQLKQKFRDIKSHALHILPDLIKMATDRLQENGCQVYHAKTLADVYNILDKLIDESLIVKCKMNTAKELNLSKYFKSRQIEVIETDLGDRIVQLSDTRPSHPLIPSLHIPKEEAAKLFNIDKPAADLTVPDIVEVARTGIRELVLKAKIGLSGANAITAEEGFICLEENEGNQRLITSLPRKHIVLAGIDKIVPSAEDALVVMKAAALALAQRSGTYLSFISGPSKTADIDFTLTYGMHGPAEVHVILIDNGRSELIQKGFTELLYCANCGACANSCPVYEQIGDAFGNGFYIGGRGILYLSQIQNLETAFLEGLNFCTLCQACDFVCPGSINVHEMMLTIRKQAVSQGHFLPSHHQLATSILHNNNPFQESNTKRCEWLTLNSHSQKTSTLLFIGCMASFRTIPQAKAVIHLLEALQFPFTYLGIEEPCCGSILRNLGFKDQFQETKMRCEAQLKAFSEIITICPGCYSTFKTAYANFLQDHGIVVKHLIEILPSYSHKLKSPKERITYHDPCHLGRQFNLYQSPRLIFKALDVDFTEMEYSRENAYCCGAGGGVLAAFPNLSRKIAHSRINQALQTQADILVTACPFCTYNLSNASQSLLVQSIQEFLLRGLRS